MLVCHTRSHTINHIHLPNGSYVNVHIDIELEVECFVAYDQSGWVRLIAIGKVMHKSIANVLEK